MPTTDPVWSYWATATNTNTTSLTTHAWQAWNATSTTTTMPVTYQWTITVDDTAVYVPHDYQRAGIEPFHSPDPREDAIRRTRARAQAMRRRVRDRQARKRAEELLLEQLDAEQAREWRSARHFHVETADGRRRYRIRYGVAGNIELVKDGDREVEQGSYLRRYCAHVYNDCAGDYEPPVEDNVLAQKFLLENDEQAFLQVANLF